MGNIQNTGEINKTNQSLTTIIDFIATDYILTQNFTDMYNLTDPAYCDKLLILTSKIISKYLSDLEIDHVARKRIGNELKDKIETSKVLYLKKKDIKTFEQIDPDVKQGLCDGISKFYIKIAQLFSSITAMINPTYTYKTRHGEKVTFDTFDRAKLENYNISSREIPTVVHISFCGRRIDCLTSGLNISSIKNNDDRFSISPDFCRVNQFKKGQVLTLDKEPGIGELEHLFYDTYDWESKKFSKMSDAAKKEYDEAVDRFWKIWTSEEDRTRLPKPKKFSDITMKNFHHTQGCLGAHEEGKRGFQKSFYRREYTSSRAEDGVFGEYVDNIKDILDSASKHEKELLDYLDRVFKQDTNPITGKKEITIVPALTMEVLKNLIAELRVKQVDMYVECEKKFYKGFKLFEKIVADRMLKTTNQRQDNLSKESTVLTSKMRTMLTNNPDLSETEVGEWNKKLGIATSKPKSKSKSKWYNSDDEESDDELTDDIAGAQLKLMLKKILKKNPDIVDKQDMEFFGKYRPALQKQYKRNKIESLLKDVDDIDKDRYRKMNSKDTDKVLEELSSIILEKEDKIKHDLSKFKGTVQSIRQKQNEDKLRRQIKSLQNSSVKNTLLDSDTDSDTESDTDSDSDNERIKDRKLDEIQKLRMKQQYKSEKERNREKELEKIKDLERLKDLNKLRELEKLKEREKLRELEKLKEREKLRKLEKLKEQEKLREFKRYKKYRNMTDKEDSYLYR